MFVFPAIAGVGSIPVKPAQLRQRPTRAELELELAAERAKMRALRGFAVAVGVGILRAFFEPKPPEQALGRPCAKCGAPLPPEFIAANAGSATFFCSSVCREAFERSSSVQ